MNDQKEIEEKMTEYNQKVSTLWDTLMGLEMQLVDQLEVNLYIKIYNRDARIVKMAGFQIPDNPASSIHRIPDRIRIFYSTVFRNHAISLVPRLPYVQTWILIRGLAEKFIGSPRTSCDRAMKFHIQSI